MTAEKVAEKFDEILDFSKDNEYPLRPDETFSKIMDYRDSIAPKL